MNERDLVLDSHALLAYFENERGSGEVEEKLCQAREGKIRLWMTTVNLGEIVYIVERRRGLPRAQEILARVEELPVEIVDVDRSLALEAAHLKAGHSLAYANCFAAALALRKNVEVMTGDPEFKELEDMVSVEWLPRKGNDL